MRAVTWMIVLLAISGARANYMPGPGASMSMPLLSWPIDGGRFTVKLAQGSDDRTLVTRVTFTAPPPHMQGETGYANTSRTYPAFAVRASDVAVMNSVSEAPHALMRRTRIASRSGEHYLQVTPTTRDSELVPDWTILSRWRAALFLGPSSGLWDHFRCWHISQSTLDMLHIESNARACAAWVHASHAQWPVQLYNYSVPRDASSGDGTTRVHARRYDTMLIGRATVMNDDDSEHGHRSYPVIIDLESRRNYLPSELDFMEPRPLLDLPGAAVIDLGSRQFDSAFTINTDSREIILGLPFFRSNFSTVTYDAASRTLAVTWVHSEPSETLRVFVSLFVTVQGALVIRWMGSARFVSLVTILDALNADIIVITEPFQLPFQARQTVYEIAGLILSGATLLMVLPHANADHTALFTFLSVQWAIHCLFTLAFLGLTPVALRSIMRGIRDADSTIALPPHHVIARQAIHILTLGVGALIGLLLSSDSLLVMLFGILVSLAMLYHVFYHISLMLVCAVGLADVSPGREGWFCHSTGWSLYFGVETVGAILMTVALQRLFIVPVLEALNNFYWSILVNGLSIIFIFAAIGAAVFTVMKEASPNLMATDPPEPNKGEA